MAYTKIEEIRIIKATNESLDRVEKDLEEASIRLKAGVLLLSNHILRMSARVWGTDIVENPRSSKNDILVPLDALLSSKVDADKVAIWTGKFESNMRQCMSIDVSIATIGYGVMPDKLQKITQMWKSLWLSRGHLSEALINMREWEMERGVSSMPLNDDGDSPNDLDALKCGNGFPEYLKVKRR